MELVRGVSGIPSVEDSHRKRACQLASPNRSFSIGASPVCLEARFILIYRDDVTIR